MSTCVDECSVKGVIRKINPIGRGLVNLLIENDSGTHTVEFPTVGKGFKVVKLPLNFLFTLQKKEFIGDSLLGSSVHYSSRTENSFSEAEALIPTGDELSPLSSVSRIYELKVLDDSDCTKSYIARVTSSY